jgi:hypothetical protein
MSEVKKKLSRRDFIQQGLAGSVALSPLSMFLSNVFVDYLSKATAHAQGIEAASLMSMFNFYMTGGPARWMWDLPLSNQATEDLGNPSLITVYGNGGSPGIYKSTLVDGIYLPWFWSGNLPTSNGGVIPAADLAHHMFMIRGVEHASDGHALNANRMLAPVPGPNLPGLVADGSTRSVPSIGITGTNPYFSSAKGLSHLSAPPGTTLLSAAMAPFQQTSSKGLLMNDSTLGLPLGTNGATEDAFDTFFSAMAQNAGSLQRFMPSSFLDRQNAKQLMKRDYDGLATEYTNLQTKYQSLVSRALKSTEVALKIVGVDDVAIPGDANNNHYTMTVRDDSADTLAGRIPIYSGTDLRGIFTDQSDVDPDKTPTEIVNLVDTFILAEYMLKNGLSQSVSGFLTGRLNKLKLDKVHLDGVATLNLLGDFWIDQHEDGAAITLMINTRYFKAISACLYELISVLKTQGMFNTTMINMVSEFSRWPDADGIGTGHGYKGAPFSFINGKVNGAICIGNIGYEKQGGIPLMERGLWGAAAPTIGTRTINAGNVASTVAAIVGVKSPSPNNMALAKVEGDNIIPLVTSRKNITT